MNWLARLISVFTGAADADAKDRLVRKQLRELALEARADAVRYTDLAETDPEKYSRLADERLRTAVELEARADALGRKP